MSDVAVDVDRYADTRFLQNFPLMPGESRAGSVFGQFWSVSSHFFSFGPTGPTHPGQTNTHTHIHTPRPGQAHPHTRPGSK